jgi:uncharacterized protein
MLGTLVNTAAIIAGSLVGLTLFRNRIAPAINESIMKALALAVIIIGFKNANAGENMMLIIFSLVIGTYLGEIINIEGRMNQLGTWLESRMKGSDSNFSKAFVTTSLIYCVGSMAILGALESGLKGQHDILFAKSMLDGVSSIIFTSTLGIGVLFSAIPVLVYQGLITVGAGFLGSVLTDPVIADMSGVGGILIIAIGLNILEIKAIRVGNMLPAIFVPILYALIMNAVPL